MVESGPDRPGARRPAARPTPSFSSPRSCRHEPMTAAARRSAASPSLHPAPAAAASQLPVLRGVDLRGRARRMRRARRPVGRRQVSILKMVYGNYARRRRRDPARATATAPSTSPPRARAHVLAAAPRHASAMSASSCASSRASPALDIVAEPLVARGVAARRGARAAPSALLAPPEPAARGSGTCRPPPSPAASSSASTSPAASSPRYPLLLLDEPTASLDAANRAVVVDLIREAKARRRAPSSASSTTRRCATAVADRVIDVTRFAPAAA